MLTFKRKRQLKLAQRRVLIDSIKIGLASPMQIQKWAERELPNGKKIGRITNPKTVDYKTLKPVKDGLFCERIFGPVKDFVCACGKRQGGGKGRFCTECEVEWTSCRTRRYRLGYIDLASPVTHVWYIKGRPNYIATLLGEKQRLVEGIAYCTKFVLGEAVLNGSGGIEHPSKTDEKSEAETVNKRERFTVSPDSLYRALETAQPPLSLCQQSDGPGVVIETPTDSTSAPFTSASGFASNPLGEDRNTASTSSNNLCPTNIFKVVGFVQLLTGSYSNCPW
jgi:DNA-directed RNA polymerase beta' subunit